MNWLKLTRIALLPTIVWDFCAGLFLASVTIGEFPWLALLALALIYHSSMILNDYADRKIDAVHRLQRPLINGSINPYIALVVAIGSQAIALGTCYFFFNFAFTFCAYLLVVVNLYNFSPPQLRKHLGPSLLATARAFSLMFGVAAVLGPGEALNVVSYPAVMAYALYFLFLSRLAQHEEHGIEAKRGISLLVMATLAPCLLFASNIMQPLLLVAYLVFAVLALRNVKSISSATWSPADVQYLIRSGLGKAPLVLGLALIASGDSSNQLVAIFSIAVVIITGRLARFIAIS